MKISLHLLRMKHRVVLMKIAIVSRLTSKIYFTYDEVYKQLEKKLFLCFFKVILQESTSLRAKT